MRPEQEEEDKRTACSMWLIKNIDSDAHAYWDEEAQLLVLSPPFISTYNHKLGCFDQKLRDDVLSDFCTNSYRYLQ